MAERTVRLEGPAARGPVVSAGVLRDLLEAVITGSQGAVRLRTQGRSTARGRVPEWIAAATEFDVEVKEGSTVLELSCPTLFEASPDQFAQEDLFPELDSSRTSLDYLFDTIEAVTGDQGADERSELYDRPLLRKLGGALEPVFDSGIETISFSGMPRRKAPLLVREGAVSAFRELEERIPPPQRIRLVGKLDLIRHSDRTFTISPEQGREKVKGTIRRALLERLKDLWGQTVLVSGMAQFTARGAIQLIEADDLRAASEDEAHLWGEVPEPLDSGDLRPMAVREPQGPRSGLNAVIGAWPGEEDDEEVAEALKNLS